MSNPELTRVVGKDGLSGVIVTGGETATAGREVLVRFADGSEVFVAHEALKRQDDGSYFLPVTAAELAAGGVAGTNEARIVLPVLAEELAISKRRVETGQVRLRTVVTERQETVDVPLEREEFEAERVEINQFVDQAPAARREGDDLIIPLLEEVLVVEKRLRLKAEVRVRLRKTSVREPQQVTLRSEEIAIDRVVPASISEADDDR